MGIIPPMKNRITHILCGLILCVFIASAAYAAAARYYPLQYAFSGITDKPIQDNINATLQNFRSRLHFPLTAEEVHHFVRKSPQLIQNAIKPYGYFKSDVKSTLVKTKTGWQALFSITPGPALPIAAMDITIQGDGQQDPAFLNWKKTLPFKVGDTLQTEQFENAKNALYDIATRHGYFSSNLIKSQIQINLKTYQATIILVFNTGPRFRFGETTFSKSTFYDSFLQKFLTYHQGEFYDAEKLEKTQEGLINSNYFNQIVIKPLPKEAVNGQVPISITMIPRKARTYTLGLGYGTDTGVRGTIGMTLRHIGHVGHRFQTLLRASQNNSSFVAKYIIPGLNPASDLFTIGAGVSNIEQSTGNANNAKIGVTYSIIKGKWQNSLTLAYLNERYNITTLPNTSTYLVYPTFESKYLNADHPRNPHRGISFEIQYATASQNILSQTNFSQFVAHLKTLYTIDKTSTRLLFRADGGHTNIANLIRLPLSLQLFAGGSRSIRGYGYNSIGPGRNLVVGSTEIQQRVYGAFYGVLFFDAGVVGNQNIFQHINMGAGPGVAWISPVGTIELTLANAFTQATKPWSIQFTMGTAL